jgi:hypothetical protein
MGNQGFGRLSRQLSLAVVHGQMLILEGVIVSPLASSLDTASGT